MRTTIVLSLRRIIPCVNLFSDRLRRAREFRNLSQSALARACGLTQSAISNYENGTRKAPREILALANALNVEANWLLNGKGPMLKTPETPLTATYQLHDSGTELIHNWPFPSIAPNELQALSTAQRQELERALRLMLNGMTQDTKQRSDK